MNKIIDFENNLGKTIKITGRVAKALWQHQTSRVNSHSIENYIDLEDRLQIVVYTKTPINCKNEVEIKGKIIKVESDFGNPNVKISDEYFEYQLIADSWKCIERE